MASKNKKPLYSKGHFRFLIDHYADDEGYKKVLGIACFDDHVKKEKASHFNKTSTPLTFRGRELGQFSVIFRSEEDVPVFILRLNDNWDAICRSPNMKINIYSGLLDVNNNKIYEDDYLIKVNDHFRVKTYKVIVLQGIFYIENIDNEQDLEMLIDGDDFMIMGNILEGSIDGSWL